MSQESVSALSAASPTVSATSELALIHPPSLLSSKCMYHAIVGKANKKEPTTGLAETYATALCGRATFHLSQVMANGRRLGIRVEELFFFVPLRLMIFFLFSQSFLSIRLRPNAGI